MSFIHYLLIGHFDRAGDAVRFTRDAPGEAPRPIVARPLDPSAIEAAVRAVTGGSTGAIPDDWSVWEEDGYLVCDRYTKNPAEVEFITRLVEETGAGGFDRGCFLDVRLDEWAANARAELARGTA
jgi:hypothetical protein